MNNKLTNYAFAILLSPILFGCTMPGDSQNDVVKAQSDAAMEVTLDNQLKGGIKQRA